MVMKQFPEYGLGDTQIISLIKQVKNENRK
jgi:hypothetical protein